VFRVTAGSLLTCVPVLGFTPGYAIFPQIGPLGFFSFPAFDLRRINSASLLFDREKPSGGLGKVVWKEGHSEGKRQT